ncbi:MAG: protein kinase domain-containing protein [Phycisphaerales bacterium]
MASEGPQGGSEAPKPERDLIEAALAGASPRGDSAQGAPDLPPHGTFPGYELVREIHRGGQGAVYLAIQLATKRRVAIKVMHGGPFRGSSGRARFEREVQILGQLNHPNIVKIHDSGVAADGSFFYVMDYVSGRSLDALIDENKKRPIDETLRFFAKVCDAVNAAHRRGVIHRDIKPANIRVTPSGEPVLVDFGLAKTAVPDVTDEDRPKLMTMTGQFIGSLPWASPEQAEGVPDHIDMRTDVYSLGVILYQMLTGKFPYEVIGHMRDVLDNILKAEPARPSTVRRQINDEVETIVLKCLFKERDRRYQTAGELARDIQHYLAGEPIEAKRASGWYVITKTLGRYKLRAGIAAGFLVVIALAAVVSSLAWAAEARERKRADENFRIVRDQARTFMVDFNRSIEKLRGGTKARELLLLKAQESLDRLKKQAGNKADDPDLLREVASACDLLGDIRGGLANSPRVGGVKAARELYAEAKRIREGLAAREPSNWRSHADLGESHRRASQSLVQEQKFADAETALAAATASIDRATSLAGAGSASLAPDELTRLRDQRAIVTLDLGTAAYRAAEGDKPNAEEHLSRARPRFDQAEAYWAERVGAASSDGTAARWLGTARDKQAKIPLLAAIVLQERIAKLVEAKDPAATALGDSCEAEAERCVELARRARADFERLSGQAPENAELRRDIHLALHNEGWAHMTASDVFANVATLTGTEADRARSRDHATEANRAFSGALRIAEGLALADESNLEAQRDLVLLQNKTGNMLRKAGRLAEALDVFRRSLATRTDLDKTDPTGQTKRDVATAQFKCGEVCELIGDQESGESARHSYQQAITYYQAAHAGFAAIRDQSGGKLEVQTTAEAARKLEECRGKMGKVPPVRGQ